MPENLRDGIPQKINYLPGFMQFNLATSEEFKLAHIQSHDDMRVRCDAFFTHQRMQAIEEIIPGWREMARYAEGQTLYHIVCALVALLALPEYQTASPAHQDLYECFVLLHDIAKKSGIAKRDYLHGFLSGVAAAQILPSLGFATTEDYAGLVDEWSKATREAFCIKNGDHFQDNCKLPDILDGIDRMFGRNTPAALIVKTVLLHVSVEGVQDWPNPTPLTTDEKRRFVDGRLHECLKIMTLVDADAWELFNFANKARYRQEILATFENWFRGK